MTRGEIWTVDIPAGNGHEQAGLRPVLIMSEIEANVVVVVPLTSNMAALRFPHTLQLMPSKLNCLKGAAVALVFQIRAIDVKRCRRRIGVLDASALREVKNMIGDLLSM